MPPPIEPTPTSLAFGAVLRRYRTGREMTQAELAEVADVHLNTVGLIERGRTAPSLDVLIRIAVGLGTTAASMVQEVETRLLSAGRRLNLLRRSVGVASRADRSAFLRDGLPPTGLVVEGATLPPCRLHAAAPHQPEPNARRT